MACHAWWVGDRLINIFSRKQMTKPIVEKAFSILDQYLVDKSAHQEPFRTALLLLVEHLADPGCTAWLCKTGRTISSAEIYQRFDDINYEVKLSRDDPVYHTFLWAIHQRISSLFDKNKLVEGESTIEPGVPLPGSKTYEQLDKSDWLDITAPGALEKIDQQRFLRRGYEGHKDTLVEVEKRCSKAGDAEATRVLKALLGNSEDHTPDSKENDKGNDKDSKSKGEDDRQDNKDHKKKGDTQDHKNAGQCPDALQHLWTRWPSHFKNGCTSNKELAERWEARMVSEGWALRKQAGDFAIRKAIVVATLLRLYDILEPQHQDGMRLREMQAPEDQWQSSKFVHKHLEVGLSAVQQSEEDGGHDPITRSGRFCSLTRHIAEMVILTAFKWSWIHVCDGLTPPVPSAVCEKTPFGTTIRCKAIANVHTSGEHIWAATITLLTNLGKVDDWAYSKFALDRSGYLYSWEDWEHFTTGTTLPELSNSANKGHNKRVWDSTTQGSTSPKLHSDGWKPGETAHDTWKQSHNKPKAVLTSKHSMWHSPFRGVDVGRQMGRLPQGERHPPAGTKTVQK